MEEMIKDVQRCFDNCLLYNGEKSPAGQRCMIVMREYNKLYEQLNVQFYLDMIPLNAKIEEL